MSHETIRKDDFSRNKALQHCCDIAWNSYNINCSNIATLCYAKNRRCESSRVTSSLASTTTTAAKTSLLK